MTDRWSKGVPGGKEVEREARRLFAKLYRDEGYFELFDGPVTGVTAEPADRKVGLFTKRNRYRRAVVTVSAPLVEAFDAKGWLDRDGARMFLSDAGAAWLRRQSGGSDSFRAQHQLRGTDSREVSGGTWRPLVVNEAECPLGWLRRRKGRDGHPMISAEQYEAGDRLRADFTRAQLTPRVTAQWDAVASSRRSRRAAPDGSAGASVDAIAAKKRFQSALDAVGPELAGILVDICCYLLGLEELEKRHGWPRRSGKAILRIALSALARHYGLGPVQTGTQSTARTLRHWGGEDYRPNLDKWR